MKSLIAHLKEEVNTQPPDISHFVHISGQLGYNDGGVYKNPFTHEKYYVKFSHEDHIRNELAANQIYNHFGIKTLNPSLISHKNRIGLASKWREDLSPIDDYSDKQHKDQLANHLVVGAITMNHDAIGGYDNPPNISFDGHQNIIMHDPGGAIGYSGIGNVKPFGPNASEIDSLRNPAYAAGRAFKHINDDDTHRALKRILPLFKEEHVRNILHQAGVEGADHKADMLAARVNYLKNYRK